MPKCIVDYCRNYAGMKRNYANIMLHGFPPKLERIKIWLQSLKENGQCFEDIEDMAEKIHAGKKSDLFRVCSEHFVQECYDISGEKKTLRKDAVPTMYSKHKQVLTCPVRHNSVRRQEHLIRQASDYLRRLAKCYLRSEVPPHTKKTLLTNKERDELFRILLNLTLEIIMLLTGEHCIVVKKATGERVTSNTCRCDPEGSNKGAHWLDEGHEKDIVAMANKITELLTGEVPIRCQDVTVCFSMEEWQYVEGHKNFYKDVTEEDEHPGNPWTDVVSSSDDIKPDRSNKADSPNTVVVCDQNPETQTVATKYLNATCPTLPVSVPTIEMPCSSDAVNSETTCCSPASPTLAMPASLVKETCSCEGLNYQSKLCSLTSPILPIPAPTEEESGTLVLHNSRTNRCPLEGPTLPLSALNLQEPHVCNGLYVKTKTCTPPGPIIPVSALTVEEASSPDGGYSSPMEYNTTFQVNTPLTFKKVNQPGLHKTYSSFSDQEGPECQEKEEQTYLSMHGNEDSCLQEENGLPVIISSPYSSAWGKEEWDNEHLPPSTLPEPTQFALSCVKQEPQSSEEENLLYGNPGKSIDNILYTSVQIKEEPHFHAEENLPYLGSNLPANCAFYSSSMIKNEPCPYEWRNRPTCTPTGAFATIKAEPNSQEAGNLRNSGDYTPMDRAWYTSATIKEEPGSCKEDSLLKPERLDTFCHVKEETHSGGREGLTNEHLDEKMEISANTNDDSTMGLNNPSIRVTDLGTNISAMSLNPECGASTPTSSNPPAAQIDSNIVLLQLHISPVLQSQLLQIPLTPMLAAGQAKGPIGDISNLTKYWRDHSKRKVPQCSDCGKLFLKPKQLREHQVTHTTPLPFRCADCGKAFRNNYQCIIHQRQTHSKLQWNIDKKPHNERKPHICSKCGKIFSEKQTLTQHQDSQCLLETFECSFCNVHYKQKVQLYLHERLHRGIDSRGSKLRSLLAKDRETAGQHWDILQETSEGTMCNEELADNNAESDGIIYSCTECKKQFVKRSHLLEHQKTHQMDSLLPCSYCSHSCSSKDALHIHEKSHFVIKSHECLYCGSQFHSKVALAKHQKTHANQKMHKCLECGRVFSKRSALVVHQRSHARKRAPPSSSDCS